MSCDREPLEDPLPPCLGQALRLSRVVEQLQDRPRHCRDVSGSDQQRRGAVYPSLPVHLPHRSRSRGGRRHALGDDPAEGLRLDGRVHDDVQCSEESGHVIAVAGQRDGVFDVQVSNELA